MNLLINLMENAKIIAELAKNNKSIEITIKELSNY